MWNSYQEKSHIVIEVEDGTTNNTVSTLAAESSQFMSPLSNLEEKEKAPTIQQYFGT
jgi:hypothetical protein